MEGPALLRALDAKTTEHSPARQQFFVIMFENNQGIIGRCCPGARLAARRVEEGP
jgi:hypothetical protein